MLISIRFDTPWIIYYKSQRNLDVAQARCIEIQLWIKLLLLAISQRRIRENQLDVYFLFSCKRFALYEHSLLICFSSFFLRSSSYLSISRSIGRKMLFQAEQDISF